MPHPRHGVPAHGRLTCHTVQANRQGRNASQQQRPEGRQLRHGRAHAQPQRPGAGLFSSEGGLPKARSQHRKNTETKQDDARCGQALQARNSGSVRKRLRHQTQKKRPFWQMRRNPFKVWPGGANREWAGLSRHLQCRKAPPPPHRSFSLSAAQTNLLQTAKAARAMRSFLCAIVRQGFIQPLQQGCQRSLIAGGQTLA